MDIYALKTLSQQDRESVFASEAIGCDELAYTKQLTPEELVIKREEFTNDSMKRSVFQDDAP